MEKINNKEEVLNTTISQEQEKQEQNGETKEVKVIIQNENKNLMGIISIVLGIIGIFLFGILAIIGLILGIISLFKEDTKWIGVLGVILSIIGIVTSPTLWFIVASMFNY